MKKSRKKAPVQDVVRVETTVVRCDGRSALDPSGHPLIYLNLGEGGRVQCPYCSRQFVLIEQ